MIFKNVYAPNSFVTFGGLEYQTTEGLLETDNTELIEYLKLNANFELVEDPADTADTKKKKKKEND